jgi:hypothetical protein
MYASDDNTVGPAGDPTQATDARARHTELSLPHGHHADQ